jgi:putative MFS transporter
VRAADVEQSPLAARLDRLPVTSFHRQIVIRIGYIFFFELGDINSFAFAAPAIRAAWHVTIGTIAGITSATFSGMFIGATGGGWFSDRVGRKRALIVTTMWYSACSLLNAFVWDTTSLFAARFLTGVGLSAMTVVAVTYVSEMFPARARGTYQAKIMVVGLCGIPVTAYVARMLVPAAPWGWRAVFVWGSLGLLFPLFARSLEESPRWFENHGRLAEAEDTLSRIEARARQEVGALPRIPPAGPAQAPGPGGFNQLVSAGYLGRVVLLIGVWTCQTLGFYGFMSWVPTLLAERGFSIVHALEQSSAISIGAVPGAWIASRISDRWERKVLIATVAVSVAACGLIYGLSSTTATIVIFGFLVAMLIQVFTPLVYAYTPECFPTEIRNTGTGISYGVGRLGNTFGPLLVAYLFGHFGYLSVFVYIAVCWLLVALFIAAFGPRTKGRSLG